jgi:signal transduction histidine kinase/CheY-like chemotaxis protein
MNWRKLFQNDPPLSCIDDIQGIEIDRRARVLKVVLVLLLFFGTMWATVFFALHQSFLGWICLGGSFFSLIVAVLLWRARQFMTLSHIVIGCFFSMATIASWYTGGISGGGANHALYFCVPILAIFLLGRQGIVWVVISSVVILGLWVFAFVRFPTPQIIPDDFREIDKVLTWLTGFVLVVGVSAQYEASRSNATKKYVEAKERAEKAMQAKGQFMANMSHELRTPMNAILGLTDVTMTGDLKEDQRRSLELVKKNTLSLLRMVEEVLDMSRIDAGKMEIHPAPFDPRIAVREMAENWSLKAQEKGIALELRVEEPIPRWLMGDVFRIKQVISNLLDNAIKFTQKGSVSMVLRQAEAGGVEVVVSDTGVGIPGGARELIFDPFAQLTSHSASGRRGVGLGLTICRQLVDLMGGKILLDSEVGVGSCFRIILPLAKVGEKKEGPGKRILAVEDDNVGRELLGTILGSAGYSVDVVSDGQTALDRVRTGLYDLVLMDVQIPFMNGMEATKQIRILEKDRAVRVPILAITAHALEEERNRCFDAGMDDFITKPMDSESLLGAVRRWIG